MEFEGSKAWTEAVEMANAKRDVLWPVAGVFLLLPALATTFLFSDFQAAALSDPTRATKMLEGMMGTFAAVVLAAFVFQMVGYMALVKLLHDRERPTVGQAISHAIACLPTIIGASLLFYVTLFVAMLAVGLVAGGLAAAGGSAAIGVIAAIAVVIGMIYVMVRLSLTMPVVVIEGRRNPITALTRSWQITGGYVLQLVLFFVVLFVAYAVISLLVGGVFGAIIGLAVGMGTAGMLILGLISGAVGAVFAVLFAAILVAAHRQLSGEPEGGISATFE
jgi:hypothetical protein